jgi:hypothetical protein
MTYEIDEELRQLLGVPPAQPAGSSLYGLLLKKNAPYEFDSPARVNLALLCTFTEDLRRTWWGS